MTKFTTKKKKSLKAKAKDNKCLGESIGINLDNLELGDHSLDMTPIASTTKEK